MTSGGFDLNKHPENQPPGGQQPPQNPYGAQQPQNPYPQNPYGGQQPYPGTPYGNQGIGPQPGDLWIRFAARIIDGIIIGIVSSIIIFAVVGFDTLVFGIIGGILQFAYFVGFEVTQGWTPGKKLLGLSVHGPNGAPKPDPQQSAIRNGFILLGVIPFIGGLLSFIAAIVIAVTINSSPTKQGKHDELAGGTIVLKS